MRDEIITARSGQAPEGGIQDKTTTCVIVSESQNLKIYKETTLLLFSQVFVFVFERISALQSQVSSFNYLLGFAVRKFQHIKMC